MADSKLYEIFSGMLLLAVLLCGLYLTPFIPLHVGLLILGGIVALIRWHDRRNCDLNDRRMRWMRAMMVVTTMAAGFSWRAADWPGPELPCMRGPAGLILLGLLAGWLFLRRDRQPLGGWGRAILAGLLVFAATTAALAFGAAQLAPERLDYPLTVFAVATDLGIRYLPGWLHGGHGDWTGYGLALAALTVLFGGYATLNIDCLKATARIAAWPASIRLWFGVLVVFFVTSGVALVSGDMAYAKSRIDCKATPEVYAMLMEQADAFAAHGRRMGVVGLELAALHDGVAIGRCGYNRPLALQMAARRATLTADVQDLMNLADLLDRLGMPKQASRLFAAGHLPDEALQRVAAADARQGWLLAEFWRERNDIAHVKGALEMFVKTPNPADGEDLRAPEPPAWVRILYRYMDYSLYAGDIDRAGTLARTILEVEPENVPALTIMGEIDYDNDRIPEALKSTYRAFLSEPFNVRVVGNLISIYVLMGKMEAAYPLQARVRLNFPERAWQGEQGSRLNLPGVAWLQGDFLPGRTHMEVFAIGTPAKGEWPLMEVWVNDEKVGQAGVEGDQARQYAFEFTARRGPNRVEIRYNNDAGSSKDEDRNLRIGPGYFQPVYYKGQKR